MKIGIHVQGREKGEDREELEEKRAYRRRAATAEAVRNPVDCLAIFCSI